MKEEPTSRLSKPSQGPETAVAGKGLSSGELPLPPDSGPPPTVSFIAGADVVGLAAGGLLITLVGIPAMADQDWGAISATSWVILAYAIVGPVYVAYALWNWAIRHRGIPRTVVYGFLVPVLGGAVAEVVLDERVGWPQVLGGVLVVAGLAVTRLGRVIPARAKAAA